MTDASQGQMIEVEKEFSNYKDYISILLFQYDDELKKCIFMAFGPLPLQSDT